MFESWYREHYHEMSDGGRWFHGGGINLLSSEAWNVRPCRVLIVRLSTARDTADSFTHQLLYQIAASCEGVFADCAWLPPPEDGKLFDHDGIPWMTGVVTKRPAIDFDCIAISNSIVQELINIPTLLRKSGIPAGKRERMARSDVPIVILGGANALFTSALRGDNSPVDAVFVGEDAALIEKIFTCCRDIKQHRQGKGVLLRQLLDIPGIVEPDLPHTTLKRLFLLDERQQLRTAPVFAGEGKTGVGVLQISEGCPCFCTFCAESWSRKPYREVDAAACISAALAMKTAMGLDRIDLYSFNFNMHREFRELLWELSDYFTTIGLKSQRIDSVADDPELMKLLHAVGKSSITVGIEGISRRLRSWLQKGLDEVKLRDGLTRILSAPLRELKLFFLATGKEEAADIDEFRNLLAFIAETMRWVNRQPRIIISMTALVRFPFTPLECESAPDTATVREIILQCERLVQAKRFEFRSASSMNEYLFSQIFVRAGDARIWRALVKTVAETGFVYYDDIPDRFMEALKKRFLCDGLSIEELLKADRTFGRLPIRLAVDDAFLEKIRHSSDGFQDRGYCLGSERESGSCSGCGACRDEEQRSTITACRPKRHLKADQLKERVRDSNRCIDVYIKCRIDETLRGISRRFIAAEIARVFIRADSLLARLYRGVDESLIAKQCETDWIHGQDLLTLMFQEKAMEILKEMCGNNRFLAVMNGMLAGKGEVLNIGMSILPTQKLTLRIRVPWKCDPAGYLKKHSLKYTAMRDGDGWMQYQLPKESLKKHLLNSMRIHRDTMESTIEIVPGEKFRYNKFVLSVIALPTERHLVRVLCEASIGENVEETMKN